MTVYTDTPIYRGYVFSHVRGHGARGKTWGKNMTYSWCELEEQLLEDMASGGFGKIQSYSVSTAGGSRNFSYRTLSELKDLLAYVQSRCAMERGQVPYVGRTCAGSAGRP